MKPLLTLVTTLLLGIAPAIAVVSSIGNSKLERQKLFSVRDFGAKADGSTDDGAAIDRAVTECIQYGAGAALCFPKGRYRLSKPVHISHADGLTAFGETGAVLIMNNADSEMMELAHCKHLTIRKLCFDRDPLSFTQGTILSVDPKAMKCEALIDAAYAAPNAPNLAKARLYPFVNPQSGTYDLERYLPEIVSWEETGNRRWTAKLKGHPPTNAWAGKRFFFAALGRGHCFVGRDLQDCNFEEVAYWGGGGDAGLYLGNLSGTIAFRHFVIGVPPGSDRMLAASGGGQIGGIRGKLLFEDCDFSKIDDDGLDILGNWVRVLEQKDKRTLRLQMDRDFRKGDRIAVWDWPEKRSRQEVVVLGKSENPDRTVTLVLDRDVEILRAGAGDGQPFGYAARDDGIDRVINLDTVGQETVIRNCRFQVFRAKCLNLKARNCTVENCTFSNSWQPAISAASEWYFQEGPPIRNLTVRNNRFVRCNHSNIQIGASPGSGYRVEPSVSGAPAHDSTDILIEGNTFEDYGAQQQSVFPDWPIGSAIRVQNALHVVIRNNRIGRPASNPLKPEKILVSGCEDVLMENND